MKVAIENVIKKFKLSVKEEKVKLERQLIVKDKYKKTELYKQTQKYNWLNLFSFLPDLFFLLLMLFSIYHANIMDINEIFSTNFSIEDYKTFCSVSFIAAVFLSFLISIIQIFNRPREYFPVVIQSFINIFINSFSILMVAGVYNLILVIAGIICNPIILLLLFITMLSKIAYKKLVSNQLYSLMAAYYEAEFSNDLVDFEKENLKFEVVVNKKKVTLPYCWEKEFEFELPKRS